MCVAESLHFDEVTVNDSLRCLAGESYPSDGLTGSYSGPEVLVLYRKRE